MPGVLLERHTVRGRGAAAFACPEDIHALGRGQARGLPPTAVRGDLALDAAHRRAMRAGRPLALSPKEFAVLERLMAAGGQVVSASELLEAAWDEMADPFSRAVQLGDPPVIGTVARAGCRMRRG